MVVIAPSLVRDVARNRVAEKGEREVASKNLNNALEHPPGLAPSDLHGWWRLIESRAADPQGNALPDPWGPEPMGSLVLRANGRMMAVLCDGRATLAPGVERQYSSYCGTYSVAGDILTTIVDGAVDASRIGGRQVRQLAREGDYLVLMPPQRKDGSQRALVWQRD